MANPREMLNDFNMGMGKVNVTSEKQLNAFMHLLEACDSPDKLDAKTKELISIGIALVVHCEHCVVYHGYKALEAGATRQEIMEAAMVAVTMGAGPAMTMVATILQETLDEFEADF